jgi:DNA-binding MarR family transcriptional regulator
MYGPLFSKAMDVPDLYRLSLRVTNAASRAMKKRGLSAPGYLILRDLAANGSVTLTEGARRTGLQRPHYSQGAHKLMKKGFVAIDDDPADGRQFILTVTSKGEQAATHGFEIEQLLDLSPAERAIVLEALTLLDERLPFRPNE